MLFDGRRAVGVRTAAGEYRADALVINADFAHAMTKLVPDHLRRRWTDAKIEKKKFSCSTFMMYLGIEGRYDDVCRTTRSTAPTDYVANLADIETAARALGRPVVLRAERVRHRPDARAAGIAARSTSSRRSRTSTPNVDWAKETPAFRARLLQQLREDRHRGCREAHSLREDRDAGRLGEPLRGPPRGDVQPRPHLDPDAAPAAAEPLRGPRRASTSSAAARTPAAGCR